MKNQILAFSFTALLCTWSGIPARAGEEADKGPKAKGGMYGGEGGMRDKTRERFLENLSPENRQRFEAAREKAMQDPALQELRKTADKANRDFFKAVRDKMIELDPDLANIVKKNFVPPGKGPKKNEVAGGAEMDAPSNAAKLGDGGPKADGKGKGWHGPKGGGGPTGLASLTDAERQQYMAARETAKNDPAVQAAEKKKQEATSPDARQAAAEEYRKTMTAAIVKADPSLATVVEKMAPPAPPKESVQNATNGAAMAPQMQME